ncbi:MAG: SusD/RagB family nutrient-binding outer membrane lipoprotein, partial [Bacteroidota bacterium]|nr:SusD/RagB family nutrient-binding outer membrane lipoprotein [Bacteroidota bacterium]
GLFFTVSCDKDFEDVNTNPNDAISVPSGLLTADIVRNAGNIMYSSFVGADMGSCWSQQWAKVNYEEEARYKIRNSVMEGTIWKGMYEDVISDAYSMEQLAIEEGNSASQAVGIIMQVYGYAFLTDVFGMVPFSEAMSSADGILDPKYDNQEDIYNGLFEMLDNANTLLAEGTGTINPDADILYQGNAANWQKFANSLKFRMLMRISGKKDVSSDLQEIASNRAIFTSNSDEAKLIYLDANPNANPIYESLVYRSRFEYKINSVLVTMLENLNDPRLEVFAEPNSDGEIRGKPSGIDAVPNDDYNYDNVSAIGAFYVDPNLPGFFMSYSELMFLMAEAANKGYITGSDEAYYYNGLKASFDFNGLSGDYDAYIAGAGTYTGSLQQIAEQNWLGLYCQGVESWTEWRRTGFPVLEPAIEAVIDEIPSRYSYPAIEQSVNADSYDAAVSAQGADLLSTKIWWMQ